MIYVAPSIWRSVDPRTNAAVLATIASNPTGENVIYEPLWNDALIARSRSLLMTKFIETTEADVIVIFDDDMVWQPEDFWKLVEGARETRSIYCGPFVTRSDKPHLASRVFPGTKLAIQQTAHRRPIEIQYAATGFVAIHRDVVQAMLEGEFKDADGTHRIHRCTNGGVQPFWPFFATSTIEENPGVYHYLSEDWAFSERARQLGFKVWMDQSIILQHMGWYPFTVADLNGGMVGLPSTGTDLVEVAGSVGQTGEPLLDTLIADVAEWTEETTGDVRRMMAAGTATVASLWEKKRDQAEGDFYRREDVGLAYLLDLANWHLNGGAPLALAECDMTGKRVLDFGAGIGTMSLAMARAGASVSIYEPNDTLRQFITWRAEKHGIALEPEWLFENYDSIVCWHVFEHLEDPESTLSYLAGKLRQGGALITDSDFCADGSHPMHHVRDDWEDVLSHYGFMNEGKSTYRFVASLEAVTA